MQLSPFIRRHSGLYALCVLFTIAVCCLCFPLVITRADLKGLEKSGHSIERLPFYDIRTSKSGNDKLLADYRNAAGVTAADIADVRDGFVNAERSLRGAVPNLKVDYNSDLRSPEVIGTDVLRGKEFLARQSAGDRPARLRRFLAANSLLIGVSPDAINSLKVVADYTNPDGNLSFVELNQYIDGIPVFRGELKAGFTKKGEIFRIINNLAPAVPVLDIPADFGSADSAVVTAAEHTDINARDFRTISDKKGEDQYVSGATSAVAERMYFPLEPGVVVPAWRVLIKLPDKYYYVMVDALRGTLLWRKDLISEQTQSATYNVFANPTAMLNVARNPFPYPVGPTAPDGSQGISIPRSLVTLIGNEPPYEFNLTGWIPDGGNMTEGNAVRAGIRRETGGAGPFDPAGVPVGSPLRTFDFPVNPAIPTNPPLNQGDSPLPPGSSPSTCEAAGTSTVTDYQRASVTQAFYIANWYHDETYRLGFVEQAHNFQSNNFGRGGLENDEFRLFVQQCGVNNNAIFGGGPDGSTGDAFLGLWITRTPHIDTSFDTDIVIHELTHGLSNRLHGNMTGLNGSMSNGMGEGWCDFYAGAMASSPSDPVLGNYALAPYASYVLGFNNYYRGLRGLPYAVMAHTGGAENRPHNPITFADVDTTQLDLTDAAFPGAFGGGDAVHPMGHIWASMLWEVRGRFIDRLGWEMGNRRILQFVTDGMKLSPVGPDFLTGRDSILAAAFASGTPADISDIWAGFALRGLGPDASVQVYGRDGATRVTESFELPNLLQTPTLTISDALGDGDGSPEPRERVQITFPLTNLTGNLSENVIVTLNDTDTEDYGTIAHGQTVNRTFDLTLPATSECGTQFQFSFEIESSLGPTLHTKTVALGAPVFGLEQSFDSVTVPVLPAAWSTFTEGGGIPFGTSAAAPESEPNSAFAAEPDVAGATTLLSPPVSIQADAAMLTFANNFDAEHTFDGGVLEISVNGGPFQDILASGGTFDSNGYSVVLGDGSNSPLGGRRAWTGTSGGYVPTAVWLPSSTNGQDVQFRWIFGTDTGTSGAGWFIDDIRVASDYVCSIVPTAGNVSIAGNVYNERGLAISGAVLTLSGGNLLEPRIARSNGFGIFVMNDIPAGETYVLTVGYRDVEFEQTSIVITPVDDLTDIEFRARISSIYPW